MTIRQRTRGNKTTWFVDVKIKDPSGKVVRIRDVAPVNTRRGAEQHERAVRSALANGTYGKTAQHKRVTLGDFIPAFLTYAENNNKTSTVKAKKSALKHHIEPFFGGMELEKISLSDIEAFKKELLNKRVGSPIEAKSAKAIAAKAHKEALSKKMVRNILGYLSSLVNLAVEQQVIARAPKVELIAFPDPDFDFLSFDEARALIDHAEPYWKTAIVIAVRAGLRIGEIQALRWEDINFGIKSIHVQRNVYRGHVDTPKGGSSRRVPMTKELAETLGVLKKRSGYLYEEASKPMHDSRFRWPLKRIQRAAGITRPIGWHMLRHTFASHCVMKGISIYEVSKWLGHTDLKMTMRYAHLAPEAGATRISILDA